MSIKAIEAGIQATRPWKTMSVPELSAYPGNRRETEVPADLLADVAANGVQEPLYVVMTTGGVPQVVDGFMRLAAATAAGQESVPVTAHPLIRMDALTPHPGNARADLDITKEMVESLRTEGCRIPLKVQRTDTGTVQIIDGHRRYHAAAEAGLTHLPYEWDDADRGAAGQFLDMITTAQHRKKLTPAEVNIAMFGAAEAGAQVSRIAKVAGVRQKDVKAVVRVRSDETLSALVTESAYAWTFDQMAALADLADDADAVDAIQKAANGPSYNANFRVDNVIAREQARRNNAAAAEAHRAELEAAGQRIREYAELSDRATPVWRLRTVDGKKADPEQHAQCQGHVWVLHQEDEDRYEPYCTSPITFGHAAPGAGAGATKSAKEALAEQAEVKAARAAVKRGNLDWDAAEILRRQWLTDLIKRRNVPKELSATLTGIVTDALVGGVWGITDQLTKEKSTDILAELLGLSVEQSRDREAFPSHLSKDPRRAVQLQFAAVAAVREKAAVRQMWRTDDQAYPEMYRVKAAAWLGVLKSLGYPLTPIEEAVMNGEPYDPKAPAAAAPAPEQEPAAEAV
ncbi:ParB N-terminal domain-containing protein [Streptomyces sp. NPDC056773]|uniref:ParB N-terminal domain-containing protein n=1 Tax=unclassified Streptomyces TaxID=2593676 RepID=UPI0036CE9486